MIQYLHFRILNFPLIQSISPYVWSVAIQKNSSVDLAMTLESFWQEQRAAAGRPHSGLGQFLRHGLISLCHSIERCWSIAMSNGIIEKNASLKWRFSIARLDYQRQQTIAMIAINEIQWYLNSLSLEAQVGTRNYQLREHVVHGLVWFTLWWTNIAIENGYL